MASHQILEVTTDLRECDEASSKSAGRHATIEFAEELKPVDRRLVMPDAPASWNVLLDVLLASRGGYD